MDIDGDSLLILPLDGVVLVGIERSRHTCGLELEVYSWSNWVAVRKVDWTCGGKRAGWPPVPN